VIRYVVGDATRPEGEGNRIICHVANDVGAWGAGFSGQLSRRWPEPEHIYREMARQGLRLGTTQVACVAERLWVVNMVAQHGLRRGPRDPRCLVVYDALSLCLYGVQTLALAYRASVHMPRIGCGLAGGRWEEIEPLVQQIGEGLTRPIAVTVYDLVRVVQP
jgi:O-acetyl-ADP-ribose deacetylase (regulator of RNase III)